jgi:L-ribulose-5-phosphate 3-epimerase
MNRRELLLGTATATSLAASASSPQPILCIFSKHLAQFDWQGVGKTARQIGFDGVDLTVRPKGHVLPERAAEDLPRAADAIRSHSLAVPMITTDLTSADDPAARPTLATASKLKIPFYKVGYWRTPSIEKVRPLAQSLFALSKECGVSAGLHNHSGPYFGSVPYEYRQVLADAPAQVAGYYFDPGHAFVEGGLQGWRVFLGQALERPKMIAVKDFYWEKHDGKWTVRWCPLGEGMVDWQAVFAAFAKASFAGPISLHMEYDAKDELEAISNDFAFLKKRVAAAYPS